VSRLELFAIRQRVARALERGDPAVVIRP
jgi:hypothetical protein